MPIWPATGRCGPRRFFINYRDTEGPHTLIRPLGAVLTVYYHEGPWDYMRVRRVAPTRETI